MPVFHDDSFLSTDGKTPIRVRRCSPDGAPRAVVQIAHGIAEHAERYDDFAAFLASHGFVVVINDHLGHGKSIRGPEDQGFFAEHDGWNTVVEDMHLLYERTGGEFYQLPYILMGHSMGSFLTRSFLIRHPEARLAGAILSGTAQQSPSVILSGKLAAGLEVRRHGKRYCSPLLSRLAFSGNNRCFKPQRTDFDWLSRDNAVVDAYVADPLCGFAPTTGLFQDLAEGLQFMETFSHLKRMNKSLPVYFFSGDMDPVGGNGKGVRRACADFCRAGMQDVTLKLYPGARHECLNELNKAQVYQDVLDWIEKKI